MILTHNGPEGSGARLGVETGTQVAFLTRWKKVHNGGKPDPRVPVVWTRRRIEQQDEAGVKKMIWRQLERLPVWVNWGIRSHALVEMMRYLNGYGIPVLNANVDDAVSKVKTYGKLKEAGVLCPTLFTNAAEAQASGVAYLGRKDGLHSGLGIKVYAAGQAADPKEKHDFYTAVLKRRHEARVHVWGNTVIGTQYKKIPPDCGPIASHPNGARYLHWPLDGYLGPKTTESAHVAAIIAVHTLGLNFGAVDILVTEPDKARGIKSEVYVLEVNTAPGIDAPKTMAAYAEMINLIRRPQQVAGVDIKA